MFTGLVEETGIVKVVTRSAGSVILGVGGRRTVRGLRKGDSIAVDGVCLTVIRRSGTTFYVQAIEETLSKTTLGDLRVGSLVNLERPLLPTTRIGGHFVLGHVDAVATIKRVERLGSSSLVWIEVPGRFAGLLIPAGSVAVNGVSLTVAKLRGRSFAAAIIPQTMKVTNFGLLEPGSRVNIEFDVLGKYVSRLLDSNTHFLSFLRKSG